MKQFNIFMIEIYIPLIKKKISVKKKFLQKKKKLRFEIFISETKQVPPGLEPGLRGSKPRVLTNYTMEPNL